MGLEVNDKFSGQTGQRGGRGYDVSNTSHVSPTIAKHVASYTQTRSKSRKGSMVRTECVEYAEIWSWVPLHPFSGVGVVSY